MTPDLLNTLLIEIGRLRDQVNKGSATTGAPGDPDYRQLLDRLATIEAQVVALLQATSDAAQNAYNAARWSAEGADTAKASHKTVVEFITVSTTLVLLTAASLLILSTAALIQSRQSRVLLERVLTSRGLL